MFDGTWRSISKMRFPGGVVGKAAMVLIFMVIAMATIVWVTRTEWVALLAMALIALVVLLVIRWMINFADKHPEAALLEGAEFLQLQGSKDHPKILPNMKEYTEDHPIPPVGDQKLLMLPDILPGEQLQIPFNGKDESRG